MTLISLLVSVSVFATLTKASSLLVPMSATLTMASLLLVPMTNPELSGRLPRLSLVLHDLEALLDEPADEKAVY